MIPVALLWAAMLAAPPLDLPVAPVLPPATLDDALEIEGESVDARVLETRMAVDVHVNGKGPYRFVVDSGADRSVIGATLAERLALPEGGMVTLQGMAGASRVRTVRIDSLRVGTSEIADVRAPALPERHLGAQGLLGIDALAEQRLMLDFVRKTITLQDAHIPAPSRGDEIVVTARRRAGQLILTQVRIGDRTVFAVIDTGSQVTIGNSALLARMLRSRRRMAALDLISVTGQTVPAQVTTLPEIRLGSIIMRDVPVAFADVPPFALFGLAKQPALLLGTDLLQGFRRISLDFRARKVRFVLR